MRSCRHCERLPVSRPRGLCWRCGRKDWIRKRYSTASGVVVRSQMQGPAPLPERATRALPGSLEKIWVMRQRARRREQLFHPDDGAVRD